MPTTRWWLWGPHGAVVADGATADKAMSNLYRRDLLPEGDWTWDAIREDFTIAEADMYRVLSADDVNRIDPNGSAVVPAGE